MRPSVPSAVTWSDALDAGRDDPLHFARLPFDHPLYIMYSSGTTGLPKCMVHGAGGTLIQHLKEHVLHVDLSAGDRIFYFTTCGWMMWNWLVSALAVGATVVLYDGAPLLPGRAMMWEIVSRERLTVFGTSAKWLALAEKEEVVPGRESGGRAPTVPAAAVWSSGGTGTRSRRIVWTAIGVGRAAIASPGGSTRAGTLGTQADARPTRLRWTRSGEFAPAAGR